MLAVLVLLLLPFSGVGAQSAHEVSKQLAQTRITMTWLQVTRPMYACESTDDSPELRALLLNSYLVWRDSNATAKGCRVLRVGEIFLLDHEQIEADTKIVVKLWSPVCPRGCVPSMTPVYGPARNIAGDYLRPVAPPKGW